MSMQKEKNSEWKNQFNTFNIKMETFLSALSKHKEPSLDCNFGKAQCFLLNANIGRKLLVDFNSKKYNKQY